MDPLSVTASVITVTTLAWQSCRTACDLVDRLAAAPQAIAGLKTSLIETQKTLDALKQTLMTASEPASVLNSVLRTIELGQSLKSAKCLCDEFTTAITSYTSRSTDTKFSKRDRLTVNLNESKIYRLNRGLGDCQRTISMVLTSINLIITTRTTDNIRQLSDRFHAQEQALADLDMHLHSRQTSITSEQGADSDRDASLRLTAELRKVCKEALSATRAKRTGQKFGDMSTDNQSLAMQGIVGEAHDRVEQSFGNMTTSNNSRAFQGQMDTASFSVMFEK